MGTLGNLFRCADGTDKLLMFFGVLGCIGDGLLNALVMYILSGVINEFGATSLSFSQKVVNKYALKLFYVSIVVGTSAFIEGICWARTAERQTSRMRKEYLKSVLRKEVSFFDTQSGATNTFQVISAICTDALKIQDTIAEKIPNCLAHIVSFLSSLIVSFFLSWRLALALLPFAALFIAPGVGFGKLLMNTGAKAKEAYNIAGTVVEQSISSIRTVYSYAGECKTLDSYRTKLEPAMELGIKQGFIKGLLIGSMGMIYAAWAFLAWIGGILVTEKGEKGGAVFVAGALIVMGGVSLMNALPNLSFLSDATVAATKIGEMIDQVPVIDSESEKGKVLPSVRGDMEFRDVDFSYPSRPDTPILQGLNLKIEAGKTVGLVGGSGSGKSTIIALLQRFYDPVDGVILLDNHKLKKLQLQWLRSQMGFVNQEPVLFATSIKENIFFGKEGASMQLVVSAAKAANAHNFITKLPDGYDTNVGQLGIQLSGGQKQRIAIARALIRDPKILLLDEATSALDAESERVVQEALNQATVGRTTIIVAHRLSTIRNSDLIAVLQSGSVVESGSHDALMQMNDGMGGAYTKMVQAQLQQSKTEKLAMLESPYNSGRRTVVPRTPSHTRSSFQSSPAYSISPGLGIGMSPSAVMQSYHEQYDQDTEEPVSASPPSQWRLLKMNAPEWKNAVIGCLSAAVSGAILPGQGYCLGSIVAVYFLDGISKIKSESRTYCFIFLGIAVLHFFTNLVQNYNFAIMGERLTKRVREMLLEKVLTFEVGWFDQEENSSPAICSRLENEANLVRSLVADRISLLVQVFFGASIAFAVSLVITWRLSLVIIAVQPLIITSFYCKSTLMKIMSEGTQKAQSKGSQLAGEAIINHRTITAFSSQERIMGLFVEMLDGPKHEAVRQSWILGFNLSCSQFLQAASSAMTYWYGGKLLNEGLITSKHLFTAFFLLMSTGRHIADAGIMSSDLAKSSSAISAVFSILDRETEIEPKEGSKAKKTMKGKIELKNVFFSYPERPNQQIFRDMSVTIEAGTTVALVGQSGSGKSTIIGLIERFYDPQSGSVLIDDCNIKEYNLRKLRSNIALVSQEPTLFAGTIRENIVYGNESATEEEITRASKGANAHQFISSMENGYNTFCGERGVQLSGGQKQRIALARAILKNPKILLLDEATSALDSVSENLVQEALEKMMDKTTCVVVAHRLSTIQNADSIAVIKDGKVVEEGSHSELLGRHGAYYSLLKLQYGHSSS